MKFADVLNAKTLRFAAVTVVLGAIGSGAWKWLLKPALASSTDFLLNVATLGVSEFKDSLYAEVARGLHEEPSLRLVSFFYLFLPGVAMGAVVMLLLAQFRVKANKEPIPVAVSDRFVAATVVAFVVFVSAFSFIQAVQLSYVNRAATHFNQVLAIASPHLQEAERLLYRSRFAQITTRADFESLVRSLETVCRTNNLYVPSFDVW